MSHTGELNKEEYQAVFLGGRHYFVLFLMIALLSGLVVRGLYLQLVDRISVHQ